MKTFNELMDGGTAQELYEFVKANAVGGIYYLTDEDKLRAEKGCNEMLGSRIYVTSSVGVLDWSFNDFGSRKALDKTLLWGLTFTSELEPKFTIYSPHEKADVIEQHKASRILFARETNPSMVVPADVPTNNIVSTGPSSDALPDELKEKAVADATTLTTAPPPLLEQVAAADAPVETTVPGNTPVMYVANRWGVDLCKVDVPDYHNNIEIVTALGHSGLGSIFSDPVANYARVLIEFTFKLGSFVKRNKGHTLCRVSLSNLKPHIFELYANQLEDGRTFINQNVPHPDLEKELTLGITYNFGTSRVVATLYDSNGGITDLSHNNVIPSTEELLFVQFGSSEEGMFSTRPDDTSMPMYGMKIIERSVTLVK